MSTIKTIQDFYKLVSTTDFESTLENICKLAGDYSYQGFKPESLFAELIKKKNEKAISDEDFIHDMSMLLTLLHARGPNVNNLKSTNTKGGDTAIIKMKKIIDKYTIVAKASGNSTSITLPRLSQTFPSLSYNIWLKLDLTSTMNKPVTETEINLEGTLACSPNCIPSLLIDISIEECQKAFFIYCLYEGALSSKTQIPSRSRTASVIVKKTKEEHFCEASRYAQLSYEGSHASKQQKKENMAYIASVVSKITDASLLACIKSYFVTISGINLPEPQTKYHYLLAYHKSKDISTLIN